MYNLVSNYTVTYSALRNNHILLQVLDFVFNRNRTQWRRQDLLRGGTKMEIMSWGTHSRRTSGPGAAAAR